MKKIYSILTVCAAVALQAGAQITWNPADWKASSSNGGSVTVEGNELINVAKNSGTEAEPKYRGDLVNATSMTVNTAETPYLLVKMSASTSLNTLNTTVPKLNIVYRFKDADGNYGTPYCALDLNPTARHEVAPAQDEEGGLYHEYLVYSLVVPKTTVSGTESELPAGTYTFLGTEGTAFTSDQPEQGKKLNSSLNFKCTNTARYNISFIGTEATANIDKLAKTNDDGSLTFMNTRYPKHIDGLIAAANGGDDTTAIDSIAADLDENAPVEWYTLQGVRVANPSAGLYIRRQGSKTQKVAVK